MRGRRIGGPTGWHGNFIYLLPKSIYSKELTASFLPGCEGKTIDWRYTQGEETNGLNHMTGKYPTNKGLYSYISFETFVAYKHWATQSFFRVKQLCPHLSASNWLSPFFICQGNYQSSIHLSPSKNLLKAFMANCLSFSLTLLINLFSKIPRLSL